MSLIDTIKYKSSLLMQILLVLFLGIAILQITNFFVVCAVQWNYVSQAERTRAQEFVAYWRLFDSMNKASREKAVQALNGGGSRLVQLLSTAPDWHDDSKPVERFLELTHQLFGDASPAIEARKEDNSGIQLGLHLPTLMTAVALTDGQWLQVTEPLEVDDRGVVWPQRLFGVITGCIILVIGGWLLLKVTRPLQQLSGAAESFGRRPEVSKPLKESGAKEVREAIHAFNSMRKQISGNLAERDRMLAAMAHDLRTPLTRAQLRAEQAEPETLRKKLMQDLADIKNIVSQGLEFARSLNTKENFSRTDITAFVQSLCEDYGDEGQAVTCKELDNSNEDLIAEIRPVCLKRCLDNLISNAVRYGGSAQVSVDANNDTISITVCDKGKGIPDDMLDKVFEPYFRLDKSRNPNSSGALGLGLAIARNMAILNHGKIELSNNPEGGLCAKLILQKAVKAKNQH